MLEGWSPSCGMSGLNQESELRVGVGGGHARGMIRGGWPGAPGREWGELVVGGSRVEGKGHGRA